MNSEASGIVVIDDGGYYTKVCTKKGIEVFPSVKGYCGNRNLTQVTGKYDFIVEYKGEKYVCGELGMWDNDYKLQMFSKSKQFEFFDLSVLIAVHQYGYSNSKIIISVPIKSHTEEEKSGRISRLKGSHTITVNGIVKTFLISEVRVTAEGTTPYWINQEKGDTYWIDIGSRTINAVRINNTNGQCRYIDTESYTLYKGLELLGEDFNPKALGDYICGQLLAKWNPNGKVYLFGGGALNVELVNRIKHYFINAEVLDNPITKNAEGMLKLAEVAYGEN